MFGHADVYWCVLVCGVVCTAQEDLGTVYEVLWKEN